MKIRLIEPKPAGFNVFDQALLPRLGLPLIGRLLADQGHDVRIYVEHLSPVDWNDVATADLAGFSATTTTAPVAYGLAASLRQRGVPTVIGGSHVTFLPDEALDHCDYVVRREGQETMLELVAALEAGQAPNDVAGLSYWWEGGKRHNPDRPSCSQETFAALPAPALELIVGHERMTNVPIMTQWGCPFDCDFCSVVSMFGRRVRARPVEDVLDELEEYRDRAAIFFYDDNFVVDRERTKRLLRGMIERGLEMSWSAQVRAEAVYADKRTRLVDNELLGLMRDSGCGMVYCGFESANPKTLELYNKRQDVSTIRGSVRAFHAYGIKVHGMFVLGSDADDEASIARTVDFAIENQIDTVQFLLLTPAPGTPFYERLVSQGRLLTHDWSLFDGHHCVIQPAKISPYALQLGAHKAMARFYSARRAWGMIGARTVRNLPFLLSLAWREARLGLQLPRVALFSLIPSRRAGALRDLWGALSRESRKRLEALFLVPGLYLYAGQHIRRWAQQAHSQAHLEFLKRLLPERAGQARGRP